MKAYDELVGLMRKHRHLSDGEMLFGRVWQGKGCIQSQMISLSQFAALLDCGIYIDWLSTLPGLARLYSYFDQKKTMSFLFKGTRFHGNFDSAWRFLDYRRDRITGCQGIWIPATFALCIYNAYISEHLEVISIPQVGRHALNKYQPRRVAA
ncbi:hypothetical protein A2801_02900 [Candidatus Woesebacteria bacterium RIFCSPHIGHO2_01_FULL_41_10]|uniref:Uncharacterized protein n=1 Tax=Candidatus Woesebacteria bacterium RIFCSPHIGHO2_01_FULL_41_10 TaxID=1802500 RepID=A0A1F7YNI3_9BACT|nr:MAG: hypothetical protein A2801_02900 [Candidatus Woesebacteria bacterium RIFCSPHIGHO2_01_FULL_41_10]